MRDSLWGDETVYIFTDVMVTQLCIFIKLQNVNFSEGKLLLTVPCALRDLNSLNSGIKPTTPAVEMQSPNRWTKGSP